ncbi:hypothetical protein BU23DRAFT_576041 [Bimuria novae-zelandiae CBS 107.79]|uniref:Uncharacterized protein n=1 Tax=Bimuria novae-zelandiae CBS 107.79 TaxID=1447943 RepID=A0A6A5UGH0_9PLEO|nr:hypothetical protein BU23DRAFT_576041 [Bimuria novae-zelandiae CBS 107.79]
MRSVVLVVRDFLSLLAVAEAEDLDYVRSKLLPHRVDLHRGTSTVPARETLPATPYESPSRSHTAVDAQSPAAPPTLGGWQLYPAAQPSPETSDSRDLFAMYATLGDQPASHEQAARVDTGMPDREDTTMVPTASGSTPDSPTSENASNTLAIAADSNESTNTIMNDVAETPLPGSSQAEAHTKFSSASPSQASSNWSLSPVLDSMYAWSASSPPPTRYLRDVKRLDSLYGGTSPHGVNNIPEIITLGDSFLRVDAVHFIESFRHSWGQDGLWDCVPLSNLTTGSLVVENVLRSLCCAETIKHDCAVDLFRLRAARILLYHYLEQKRIDLQEDPNLPNLLS